MIGCKTCKYKSNDITEQPCSKCVFDALAASTLFSHYEPENMKDCNKTITNRDKLMQLTDEELAECIDCQYGDSEFDCIHNYDDISCKECKTSWLKAEAE